MEDNQIKKEKCKHDNISWAPLHECHFCNNCQHWVDYDYTLKKWKVYRNGKWIAED